MTNFMKFSTLAALVVASATFASADTINLASNSTTVSYLGYQAGTAPFNLADPSSEISTGPAAATVNIGDGGIWAPAIPGSSWVSYDNTAPNTGNTPANGYYTFESTFTVGTAADYEGTMSLMADDTVAVYLNGVLIVPAGAIGSDATCSDNVPTCTTVDTVAIGSYYDPSLVQGTNTLTFVVEQTGNSSMGLDYTASLTSVPEPSSLMLLGTGLLGSAGALFRRMRS